MVQTAEGVDWLTVIDFIAGQVVVTYEAETRLVNIRSEGQLLSPQHLRESVATIVRVVDLTDLNGIISQVILNDKGQVFRLTEESEHLAVMIEELLLAGNFTTSESLFHVLLHFIVTRACGLDKGLLKSITRNLASLWLGLT